MLPAAFTAKGNIYTNFKLACFLLCFPSPSLYRIVKYTFLSFFPIFVMKGRWSHYLTKMLGHQVKRKQLVATDGVFSVAISTTPDDELGRARQESRTQKKKKEKSKLYFIYNMNILGLTLPIILNSRKKTSQEPRKEQGLWAVSSNMRLGAVIPAVLHVTLITYPSLVLIIQPVLNPFAILFCFSPCCLGSSWTKGAGKIRGMRNGKYTWDVCVWLGSIWFGKIRV